MSREDKVDKKLERLAAKSGGRIMHDIDKHEFICFRPSEFEAFCETLKNEERERCAKLIDEIGYSHSAGLNQLLPEEFAKAADAIRGIQPKS
jgi:hypothetical protein